MATKAEAELLRELTEKLVDWLPGPVAGQGKYMAEGILDYLKDNRYLFTAGDEVHKIQESEFMDSNGESATWHVWTEPEEV